MSWVFENVVILIATMVMKDLMTLVKFNKYCHFLTKLNISRNTVSGTFENVLIAATTIVMTDLLTCVKLVQGLSLYNQA